MSGWQISLPIVDMSLSSDNTKDYSNLAIRTIIKTPVNNPRISLMDCPSLVSSNNSGMTDTVAMYIKPPAVKGKIHSVAESPMFSASKPQTVPAKAPVAVVN